MVYELHKLSGIKFSKNTALTLSFKISKEINRGVSSCFTARLGISHSCEQKCDYVPSPSSTSLLLLIKLEFLKSTKILKIILKTMVHDSSAVTPSRCSLGCSLRFLLQQLLRVSAAPINGGMGFLSLRQLAVTTSCSGVSVFSFRTHSVQVAAPAPQTTGRLLTVCPNLAELLAVGTMRSAVLSPVRLYPDCYVAEGCQA
jgi:hypothetical protein